MEMIRTNNGECFRYVARDNVLVLQTRENCTNMDTGVHSFTEWEDVEVE